MSILEPVAAAASITTDELRAGSTTRPSRSSTSGRSPPTTAGASAARRAAATSRARRRSRPPGSAPSTGPRSPASSPRRARSQGRDIVVYGDGDADAHAARGLSPGRGPPRRRDARGRLRRVGRGRRRTRSIGCSTTSGWSTSAGSAALLAGESVEAAPSGHALLFHVNFGVPEEYADGHIPGAHYLDTNWLESPADWNRRIAGRAGPRAPRAGDHGRHDGRSSTAATPRATRTRSGRVAGRGRSRRRAPR